MSESGPQETMLRRLVKAFPSEKHWNTERVDVWRARLFRLYQHVSGSTVDAIYERVVAERRYAPTPDEFCRWCYELERDYSGRSSFGRPDRINPHDECWSAHGLDAWVKELNAARRDKREPRWGEIRDAYECIQVTTVGERQDAARERREPKCRFLTPQEVDSHMHHLRRLWDMDDDEIVRMAQRGQTA
jgi:hypothetical protein